MVYIVSGWALFLFFVWLPVERAHAAFCFNNYDLGIYAQALTLLSLEDLNPYLSTRDIKIFNDHFDPILFLFAPLTKFVEPSLLAIRVEMLSIILASAAPLWLWRHQIISKFEMLVAFSLILFSPMTLIAAFYPAHPGTWALAPLAWMLASLYAKRYRLAIGMLVILLLCKEEFPVVAGFLGVILILQKQTRVGFTILIISFLWFCAVFFLRPIILGKSDYYTSAIVAASGLTTANSGEWCIRLAELLFWTFTPALLLCARKTKVNYDLLKVNTWLSICLGVSFALITIRLIGGYYGNHRAAPLAVVGAFIIFGSLDKSFRSRRLRKILFGVFLLGTAVPFLELGSRAWRDKPFKKHCPSTPGRIEALNEVANYLTAINAERVLAGGNLVPHLVRVPGVAHVGATKADHFRFFFIEKHDDRSTWPLSHDELKQVESEWRGRPGVNVLRDDQHVLLIENKDNP